MHTLKINDVVQFADANLRSEFPDRIGIIVGTSGSEIQVEVLWHELPTPQLVDRSVLQIAKVRRQDRSRSSTARSIVHRL
jgi:hypothetical protein